MAKVPASPPEAALARLNERVVACRACPRLVDWREQAARQAPAAWRQERYWARPLPGLGDPSARLVIVGLAPAAHGGNRTGRMFTGDRSGDFLFAGLWRHGYANQPESRSLDDGLRLTDAYVTAAVRCAPPGNRPLPPERDMCLRFLAEELPLLGEARVYLALGGFALESLTRLPNLRERLGGRKPRFAHGAELPLSPAARGQADRSRVILCTYHPSQRNVFTGLLTEEMFDAVVVRARQLTSS